MVLQVIRPLGSGFLLILPPGDIVLPILARWFIVLAFSFVSAPLEKLPGPSFKGSQLFVEFLLESELV